MSRTLGQLFAAADELITGKAAAQEKTASMPSTEIQKLAAELLAPRAAPAVKVASTLPAGLGAETICKIAHARAIMDTLINLPVLAKMARIEAKARESGAGEEKIAEFFEKNASTFPFRSSVEHADWLMEG